MPSLTIRHVTTYRYRQPVAFGEHRMMLRPRDSHDQRVIEASLEISPRPVNLQFVRDAFGNHVGIAHFSERSQELRFESTVNLEHLPLDPVDFGVDEAAGIFPPRYTRDEMRDLVGYFERHTGDPNNDIGQWVRQYLPRKGRIGNFHLLTRMSEGIHRDFQYRRREARGIQRPKETLRLGHGSCRDFALLLIEAARSLGFAARFASGYLALPLDDWQPTPASPQGATHAWAQIYLPGTDWVSFDPTCGSVGNAGLVTVAVARDPSHATPLHGTFIGFASDHISMDVQVRVTPDLPEPVWVAAKTPRWCN